MTQQEDLGMTPEAAEASEVALLSETIGALLDRFIPEGRRAELREALEREHTDRVAALAAEGAGRGALLVALAGANVRLLALAAEMLDAQEAETLVNGVNARVPAVASEILARGAR